MRHARILRGDESHDTGRKLTPPQVRALRAAHARKVALLGSPHSRPDPWTVREYGPVPSITSLAARFGVSIPNASMAARGLTYRHIR